jgi:hypothetical protein
MSKDHNARQDEAAVRADTERLKRKHYADEEFRRSCLADWPDDDVPAHEDPPHDRDRFLPVPRW